MILYHTDRGSGEASGDESINEQSLLKFLLHHVFARAAQSQAQPG